MCILKKGKMTSFFKQQKFSYWNSNKRHNIWDGPVRSVHGQGHKNDRSEGKMRTWMSTVEFLRIFVLQFFNVSRFSFRDWRRKRWAARARSWWWRFLVAWRMASCYTWIASKQDPDDWRVRWVWFLPM